MAITIETFEDEVGLVQYATPRMELLSIIDTGVYPNAKLLLKKYAEFNKRLEPDGDLAAYKEHDDRVTAQIRPYTPTIVQNLSVVIQIFEGIAAVAPLALPHVAATVAAEKAQQESEQQPE